MIAMTINSSTSVKRTARSDWRPRGGDWGGSNQHRILRQRRTRTPVVTESGGQNVPLGKRTNIERRGEKAVNLRRSDGGRVR